MSVTFKYNVGKKGYVLLLRCFRENVREGQDVKGSYRKCDFSKVKTKFRTRNAFVLIGLKT